MKNIFVVMVMLLLLTSCGANKLILNKEMASKKTFGINNLKDVPAFSEDTIGQSLLKSASVFLAGPILSAGVHGHKNYVESDDQAIIKRYSPVSRISEGVKRELGKDFNWTGDNPDYIFEFRHSSWGIRHHVVKVTRYNLSFSLTLTIKENNPSEGSKAKSDWFTCGYASDSKYSYDEVFENASAVVKDEMENAAAECIEELTGKVRKKLSKTR